MTSDTDEGDKEDPLSLHKYLYCKANPVDLTDPSGQDGDVISLDVSLSLAAGLAAFSLVFIPEARTHAVGNLMQAAWTETMTLWRFCRVAAAESALSVARTSVRKLIEDAKGILKRAGRVVRDLKIVPMPRSVIPAVANHVEAVRPRGNHRS